MKSFGIAITRASVAFREVEEVWARVDPIDAVPCHLDRPDVISAIVFHCHPPLWLIE